MTDLLIRWGHHFYTRHRTNICSVDLNFNIDDLDNDLENTEVQTRPNNDLYIDLYLPTGSR